MAINRFDQPAQYEAVNTYSPIPFQEMAMAVDYRNKDAAATMEAEGKARDALVATGLTQVRLPGGNIIDLSNAPGGFNDALYRSSELNKKINSTADRLGTTDRSDQVYKQDVRNIIGEVQQENTTGVLAINRENVKKWSEMEKLLTDKSVEAKPWRANAIRNELERYKVEGGKLNYAGVNEDVDRVKESIALLNPIDAEMAKDPILAAKGRKGVSEEKIKTAFMNLFPQSKMASDIQEQAKYEYEIAIKEGIEPEVAQQMALKSIQDSYQELENTVVSIYRSSDQPVGKQGFGGFGDLKDMNFWQTPTSNTPSIKVSDIESLGTFNAKMDDYSRSVMTSMMTEHYDVKEGGSLEDFNKNVASVKSKFTNTAGLSDEEFISKFNKAIPSIQNQSLTLKTAVGAGAEANVDYIKNNISNSNFYIPSNSKSKTSAKSTSFKDTLKYLGLSQKEFDDQLSQSKNVSLALDGPEPGMFVVQMYDKDGEARNVFISGSRELREASREAWEVSNKYRNLDDKEFLAGRDENGNKVYRRLKFSLGDGNIDYTIQEYTSKDGKDLSDKLPEEMKNSLFKDTDLNISDVHAQTYNQMKNTPIVGFNYNWYNAQDPANAPMNGNPMMLMMMQMFAQSMGQ